MGIMLAEEAGDVEELGGCSFRYFSLGRGAPRPASLTGVSEGSGGGVDGFRLEIDPFVHV